MDDPFFDWRHAIHSAVLWTIVISVLLVLFLMYGARPLLHLLGLLLQLMGGPGLDGTDL